MVEFRLHQCNLPAWELVWRCLLLRCSFVSSVRLERNRSRTTFTEKIENSLLVASCAQSGCAVSARSCASCSVVAPLSPPLAWPLPSSAVEQWAPNVAAQPLCGQALCRREERLCAGLAGQRAPGAVAASVTAAARVRWGLARVCRQYLVSRLAYRMGLLQERFCDWFHCFLSVLLDTE